MQLTLGTYSAHHELPDGFTKWTISEIKAYMDEIVPGMMVTLKNMKREADAKLKRKLK